MIAVAINFSLLMLMIVFGEIKIYCKFKLLRMMRSVMTWVFHVVYEISFSSYFCFFSFVFSVVSSQVILHGE